MSNKIQGKKNKGTQFWGGHGVETQKGSQTTAGPKEKKLITATKKKRGERPQSRNTKRF